jgi:hypothetical protein
MVVRILQKAQSMFRVFHHADDSAIRSSPASNHDSGGKQIRNEQSFLVRGKKGRKIDFTYASNWFLSFFISVHGCSPMTFLFGDEHLSFTASSDFHHRSRINGGTCILRTSSKSCRIRYRAIPMFFTTRTPHHPSEQTLVVVFSRERAFHSFGEAACRHV